MINPFKKSYTAKELNIFRFLSKIKIFEKLTYDEMAHFLPYLYLRRYKGNEAVFFRGDPSNALYLVKSGKVSLSLDVKEKLEVLRVVRSGEAFGSSSLLDQTYRIYNSIVDSESAEMYVVPKVNIYEIFSENEKVKAKMITSLAEIYNGMMDNLFKAYKSSLGFFNLAQVYVSPSEFKNGNSDF
ncbi:MAG: Crp/Fnr family transcriptional regulator [Candidatus Cyclobacteriaceae bacterium M3_2C_046]